MIIEDRSYGVIVVLRRNNIDKFLCLKHVKGHYGFPKGHIEGKETIKETAIRELEEEAGITECNFPDLPTLIEEYDFVWEDKKTYHKIVEYFIGFANDDKITIQEKEIIDYKWVTYEEALQTLTYNNSKEVLRKAKEYLDKYEF